MDPVRYPILEQQEIVKANVNSFTLQKKVFLNNRFGQVFFLYTNDNRKFTVLL
jgi:hypothetical protein